MQACSAMQTRSCIQFCMKAGGGGGGEHGGKGECGVGGAGGGQLPSGADYKKSDCDYTEGPPDTLLRLIDKTNEKGRAGPSLVSRVIVTTTTSG